MPRSAWRVALCLVAASATAAVTLPSRMLAQEPQPGTASPRTPTRTNNQIECHRFDSSAKAIRVDEIMCLKQLADVASRQGDQLRVKLANGKTKTYVSGSKACEQDIVDRCIIYRLAGFFPAPQMILVYALLYEGDFWLLVSRRTGNQIKLIGPPHFSPSGSRLVSMEWDESEANENGVDIWSLKSDPPTLEWRNRQVGVEFDRWVSDERLVVKMVYSESRAEVVRTNGKWELKQSAPNP